MINFGKSGGSGSDGGGSGWKIGASTSLVTIQNNEALVNLFHKRIDQANQLLGLNYPHTNEFD